jgi:hypothetical protein
MYATSAASSLPNRPDMVSGKGGTAREGVTGRSSGKLRSKHLRCRLRRRPQPQLPAPFKFALQASIPVDYVIGGEPPWLIDSARSGPAGCGAALFGIRKIAASCSKVRMGLT